MKGKVTVFSEALVEENRGQVKSRIGSRGVGLVYPFGGEPGARAKSA